MPEFEDVEIALTDINAHNLDMIAQIIRRIVEVNGLKTRVTATTDRRRALEGARYVMNVVRIGGLEAFADDIRIPLKYGVDQCVGDTICAGGILYGQRGIPAMLDFCKDIREVAEPDALLAELCQPDGDDDLGRDRPWRRQHRRPVPRRAERPPPDRRALGVPMDEVDIVCSGINHQTWYLDIRHNGRKVSRDELTGGVRARIRSFRCRKRCASTC